MNDDDALRDLAAAQLAHWSSPGQSLNTDTATSTAILYAGDFRRRFTRQKLIRRYRDRRTPARDGTGRDGYTNMLNSSIGIHSARALLRHLPWRGTCCSARASWRLLPYSDATTLTSAVLSATDGKR